ncbi:MAG: zinc dependent phospholipase C family protein [Bryobacterales bacterium]|nr:zinc dependent phospholipase C family protein [Bryobacterales bacterium]
MSAVRNAARLLTAEGYRPQPGRSGRINPDWRGADPKALGQIIQGRVNFANLGAIGPDLFFFLPDFRDSHGISISSVLVTVLNFLESAYGALDPYITKWEKYLGPISEDTAEEMSRLTGGLSETVGNISGELSSILITLLENFLTGQADWWSYFSLGLNVGFDDQAFFWSDMGHYRSTGNYGRTLWQLANDPKTGSDELRSYALGYISHIGTDVTGHPFVNTIAGGPFRLHWQRHHLVENHMDAFWYLADGDPNAPVNTAGYDQLTESALYYDIAFREDDNSVVTRPGIPLGQTLREKYDRRRMLDIDSKLPDEIATLLIDAMTSTFYDAGLPHPKILSGDGRPSNQLIGDAYDLFFRYLKLVTVDGFSHEPPDPPDVFPNLQFPTPTDPASDSPPSGGGGDGNGSFWDDLLNFILSVINVLGYIAEVALYLATLPWAILSDIVTYPLRLGLYYALELPLYHLLKNFRAVMVLTGYMAPMKDEIATSLILVGTSQSQTFDQVLAQMGDPFGAVNAAAQQLGETPFRDQSYPRLHPDDEFHHPWSYPQTAQELGFVPPGNDTVEATAGPHPTGASPEELFNVGIGTSPEIRDSLETAPDAFSIDVIDRNLARHQNLGDPVTFSSYLMWLSTRDVKQGDATVEMTDWNLDSDRGYGYHCWDWSRHINDPAYPPQPDPENNDFNQPCVWPEQSDQSLDAAAPSPVPTDIPLRVHWVPGEDPGCNGAPQQIH